MKDKASPLFSQYIIDGVQMDETPFSALYDCLDGNGTVDTPDGPFEDIIDEYLDKKPASFHYNADDFESYVDKILRTSYSRKSVDLDYPVFWTRAAINALLLDNLFKDGHFTLQDSLLMARWDWNNDPAGNMAAFYDSTITAGHYLFDLGVRLDRYFVESNRSECRFEIENRGKISSKRKCPDIMIPNPDDWLMYIPFDNGRMNLGGSALSKISGHSCELEPDIQDPDYFIDCFELVRELVEDGVIVAGIPVGRGGLAVAAEKFRGRKGMSLEIGGIMSAKGGEDAVKVLFSETPGVLIQIHNIDYDYLDSQFLLQETAYYPVGHPDPDGHRINLGCKCDNGVAGILESLLKQASEGED